jgi:UDP-N-acetylglucosamine 2-epimerase (non-hydrolysing)
MSGDFFQELGIREPDINLAVGSRSHVSDSRGNAAARRCIKPDAVIVVGDVNSTLVATLAAVKLDIPVAQSRRGLRSNDRSMPEEVNRLLVDAMSRWLFVSEPAGVENLQREGVGARADLPRGKHHD